MKGLVKFIKRLTGTLEKNTVLEQIKSTRGIVEDNALPLVRDYAEYFSTNPIESKKAKILLKQFGMGYGERVTPENFLNKIESCLSILNFGKLEKLADNILEEINLKEGMSVKTATVIRVSEYLTFVAGFTLDFLMAIIVEEENAITGKNSKSEAMPQAKVKEVIANTIFYGKLISFFNKAGDSIYKDFNNLPDMIVDDNEKIAAYNERNYGMKSKVLSSMPMATSNFVGNPFYHMRLQFLEWDNVYFEFITDYKKTLERKLLRLKELKNNEENPALEKEIEYYEKKVAKLDYKIKKMQDEVS